MQDVLREAEKLVAAGVKELLVVSQDTSAYGVDLKYAGGPWRGARSENLRLPAVPEEIKEARWKRFMERQQAVSARPLKKKIGKRLPVIIYSSNGTQSIRRTRYDAPEIDGTVRVTSRRPLRVGDVVTVKIEGSDANDLDGLAA